MKKKKKLTNRQKAINRIVKRLKTMESHDITLKIKPTKKNIEEIIKANKIKVNKDNINEIVEDLVSESQMISRSKAKEIKVELGLKKISDVQKISGMELHDIVKKLYDEDNEETADEVLLAYGY